jgi:hypothetical protein
MAPPRPIVASLIFLTKLIIYREILKQNAFLQARTGAARCVYLSTVPLRLIYKNSAKSHLMGPSLISHLTSQAKKYNVQYNVPRYHSCADPTSEIK